MKFGKTTKQKKLDEQSRLKGLCGWQDWFAWRPKKLQCGRWAWLELVETHRPITLEDGKYFEWETESNEYREKT